MKFQTQTSDLKYALDIVTLVTPIVATSQGASGYLFVVKDGKCSIHSRDEQRRIRVDLEVSDLEGEGSFVYPADKVAALQYLEGTIEFEAGQTGDRFWVKYTSDSGARAERSTCDPDLLQSIDEDVDQATEGYTLPSAILKEGLQTTKSYIAKVGDNRVGDQYKTVQLFDAAAKKEWAKGDGCLYASDHIRMIYFMCEAFKGKGLAIHGQHLPTLMSFLSKCEGEVRIRAGEGVTFLVNSKGSVFGWSQHDKQHGKYAYYPLKMDGFVLKAAKASLMRTLKLVRAELDPKKDKIRIEYSHEDKVLRYKSSETSGQAESNPVPVEPLADEEKGTGQAGLTSDFAGNINIDQMLDLVADVKATHVELRASIIDRDGRDYILFRTIERFPMSPAGKVLVDKKSDEEVYLCEVTRFMPSKD